MQIFLIIFAALSRLIPHPWNFTPLGAFGLFAGATMPLKKAWLVPILPLLIADLFLGFYSWQAMVGVYAGFVLSVFIGRFLIGGRERLPFIAGGVGLNVLMFFLVSNFGVWASGAYTMTFEGLIACYVAGIPFIAGTLLGDAAYAALLFGGKALFIKQFGARGVFAKYP